MRRLMDPDVVVALNNSYVSEREFTYAFLPIRVRYGSKK